MIEKNRCCPYHSNVTYDPSTAMAVTEAGQKSLDELVKSFEEDMDLHIQHCADASARGNMNGESMLSQAIDQLRAEGCTIDDAAAAEMLRSYKRAMAKATRKPLWRRFLDLLSTFRPC
jgi:hypothetical protein